ncbi:short-chain dehydrogenase [Gloeophyllum trabeum ATCC 11539]|uniref:Short-chain dehydrogenase n=1 Tax=Gloeophyllum trabeum (strain ATCC 11539 / FP-39264 / Madison 617) TaxID=670483 RepID=S7Q2I0_GLOTA|nr:short-chain dehydrogenase [Gloeophyllum trabeum ATCC 11539]EPQ53757.1 short-chain dehydrogenase [Gloeophyllum trabeum ATCC 11539]
MSKSITSNPSFGAETSAEEVAASLSSHITGKVILVTGVTPGGLGAHFVEVSAAHKPKLLILAGRDPSKLAESTKAIESAHPDVKTRALELDLSSQAKVRKAAEEVLSWSEPIDLLVNNAAIMAAPYQKTVDGLESQFGTNHIGHFLFTNLIMPKILQSKSPRIVNVSSSGHRLSAIRWDDLDFKDGKEYNKWAAYGQAKTANILFSVALAEKLGSKGLTAFSLHPGVISTNLARFVSESMEKDFAELHELDKQLGNKEGNASLSDIKWKTLTQGTATHVVAAFDPALARHNGVFLIDCQLAPDDDIKPYALDKTNAERLWKLSEDIVGQKFTY